MQSTEQQYSLRSRGGFLILLGLALIFFTFSGFVFEKGAFLKWLNQFQSLGLDLFFNFFTLFGNGIFIIAFSLVLLFVRKYEWKLPTWNALLYIISGLLVQIPKRIMKLPRPKKFYLEEFELFNKPIWAEFGTQNSFPSGHTTSAFAMLVFLALVSPKAGWRYVCLGVAILAGISRVYLLQHFLMDVSAGAVFGSACGILAWFLYRKFTMKRVNT